MNQERQLPQIHEDVQARVETIAAAHGNWPCREGCDECCRRLAAVPLVSAEEWRHIASALDAMPAATAAALRQRIRDSAGVARPVVCPLLDSASGSCLVYPARPVACRAYGFYAEREAVLGCSRIESVAHQSADVIWGNHTTLEARLDQLGPAAELWRWLEPESHP